MTIICEGCGLEIKSEERSGPGYYSENLDGYVTDSVQKRRLMKEKGLEEYIPMDRDLRRSTIYSMASQGRHRMSLPKSLSKTKFYGEDNPLLKEQYEEYYNKIYGKEYPEMPRNPKGSMLKKLRKNV